MDSGFLQMFSFPMLKGNPSTALNDMHSVVLTEKTAKSLFGNEDAMGKIIKIDNKDNFTVTGILKDLPTIQGSIVNTYCPGHLKNTGRTGFGLGRQQYRYLCNA